MSRGMEILLNCPQIIKETWYKRKIAVDIFIYSEMSFIIFMIYDEIWVNELLLAAYIIMDIFHHNIKNVRKDFSSLTPHETPEDRQSQQMHQRRPSYHLLQRLPNHLYTSHQAQSILHLRKRLTRH